MNALVLGATGFIGGHIARAALEDKWTVRALRRDPERSGLLGDLNVTWVEGDLDQPEGLETIFQDIDVVFHAAGYYPSDSKNVPTQVARSLQQMSHVLGLMRAKKVKRLVYTSSSTTMVPSEVKTNVLVDEDTHYVPGFLAKSAYYECKAAMESQLLKTGTEGLEVVILNPTMVLGPGDYTRSIGAVFLAVARGWGLVWLPANVNVVDVRDVARAHVNAAQRGRSGERYLLGGHNLSLRQLMQEIANLARVRGPRLRMPLAVIDAMVWLEDHIPGVNVYANHLRAVRYWPHYAHHKARQELGVEARPLGATLRDTLESFRKRGFL